jgi:hypothetical protein
VDEELNPVLGAPLEPLEDVWAAAVSAAVDDPRDAADLAALVPEIDAPDVDATAVEPEADPQHLVASGPATEDASGQDTEVDLEWPRGLPEASPDADDAGWAG